MKPNSNCYAICNLFRNQGRSTNAHDSRAEKVGLAVEKDVQTATVLQLVRDLKFRGIQKDAWFEYVNLL